MESQTFSLEKLRDLFSLCREFGVVKLRLDGCEFNILENLQPTYEHDTINTAPVEETTETELAPGKAADLKRNAAQQNALRALFNDL
jgi:hypothetical protein